MGRLDWFRLEGDTPKERIKRNPLQLLVLVLIVWFFAIGIYVSMVGWLGEFWTAVLMILTALAAGLHIRRFMVSPPKQ